MPTQAVRYQAVLLTELIRRAERETNLRSAEAEKLRQRVADANSEQDIEELWAEMDQHYQLLNEEMWAV